MGDLARGHGHIARIVIRSEERDIVSRLGAGRVEGQFQGFHIIVT